MRLFFIPLIFLICISCNNQRTDYLIGSWKLDSSSGPNAKLFPAYMHFQLDLKDPDIFYYEWSEGDVSGKQDGKFYLKDSANFRVMKLVGKSGSANEYIILESNTNRIKATTKESYSYGDSTITFNRVDIFKKIE